MKSMNNDDDSHNNNNWLGFSLSPNMKMEVPPDPHHHHQHNHNQTQSSSSADVSAASVPTGFYHSSPHLNYGLYYAVEGENGGLYSPLSMMPLKSDGSLCIMEALSRSQPHQG